MDKLTATKIKNLLIDKHKNDIIVTECKMGSAGSRILDAWVLKKTWSPRTSIGYEVKVSRSDFLQDDKWRKYMDTCHEFYFVCPWGLIDKTELPEKVGLMWSSKNGTRLYTRRKAVRRKEEPEQDLLYYILMNRVKITSSNFGYNYNNNKKKYWQQWLKNRELDREFGRMVSEKIGETVRKEIDRVDRENRQLRQENESLQRVKEKLDELKELGITTYDLKKVLNEGIGGLLENSVGQLRNNLNSLKRSIGHVESSIELQARKMNDVKEVDHA